MNGGNFDRNPVQLGGGWSYSPKVNGWRALVNGFTRQMWNRYGNPLTIDSEFKPALDKLEEIAVVSGIEWWDCEALQRRHNIGQGCLIVLDYVSSYSSPYQFRHDFLGGFVPELDLAFNPKQFPLLSTPPLVSPACWNDLKAINQTLGCDFYEGLVAKKNDSLYPIQLMSPDRTCTQWVKFRWAW